MRLFCGLMRLLRRNFTYYMRLLAFCKKLARRQAAPRQSGAHQVGRVARRMSYVAPLFARAGGTRSCASACNAIARAGGTRSRASPCNAIIPEILHVANGIGRAPARQHVPISPARPHAFKKPQTNRYALLRFSFAHA